MGGTLCSFTKIKTNYFPPSDLPFQKEENERRPNNPWDYLTTGLWTWTVGGLISTVSSWGALRDGTNTWSGLSPDATLCTGPLSWLLQFALLFLFLALGSKEGKQFFSKCFQFLVSNFLDEFSPIFIYSQIILQRWFLVDHAMTGFSSFIRGLPLRGEYPLFLKLEE